jgi:disulfide oxidoreductase YuzD
MSRRFGDAALVLYHDALNQTVREERARMIDEIESRGLLYPVTVIDGVPLYDGAVSYPAILRAVGNKLAEAQD